MKKKIVLLIVCAIIITSCSKTKGENQKSVEPEKVMVADEKAILEEDKFEKETVFTVEVNFDLEDIEESSIKEKYGAVYVTYELSKEKVLQNGKYRHNVLNRNYFYKKDGKEISLGSITLDGVFDKNGKCIMEHPFSKRDEEGFSYYGYDLNQMINQNSINYSFVVCTWTFFSSTTYDGVITSEVYAFLKIDTKNDTLAIIENPF